jgi:hypothetical protein
MRPTSDTAIQRPDLGLAVWEAMQAAPLMGFIGLQILPIFPVALSSAEYPVIPKETLFNLLDTRRSSKGTYNRGDGEFESGHYKTSENGLERRVDDRYAAIYATLFDYELTISKILLNEILRSQEYRVQNKIFNATNFTAHNAATAWSTAASATPKSDIDTGKETLRSSGILADTLILNYTAFLDLTVCDAVQEAVYQLFPDAAKTGQISINHLKTYFDIEKILVAGALYNTAARLQDASLSDMWGSQYAMLCKTANPGQDIIEPCIGRTFLWNEGAREEVIVEEYYSNEVRGNVLRVRHDTDEAFLSSYDEDNSAKSEISKACGYLIDATAAS